MIIIEITSTCAFFVVAVVNLVVVVVPVVFVVVEVSVEELLTPEVVVMVLELKPVVVDEVSVDKLEDWLANTVLDGIEDVVEESKEL